MSLRRNIPGSNTAALAWADSAATTYSLKGLTRDVLVFIATNTCFKLWRKFFVHIAAITKKIGCSRTSVNRALKVLRDLKLISYDGQVHVGKVRPVAVYRLSGTPECPLPEWVVEAREATWEPLEDEAFTTPLTCEMAHRTEPTSGYAGSTQEPSLSKQDPDMYRPALPVKTGPQAEQQVPGAVRQPTHLRWLRSLAEGFLEHRGVPVPARVRQGSQEAPERVAGGSTVGGGVPCRSLQGAVTYCHPPMRGAAVTPFTDPTLGALTRDTRMLYLGLLELHTRFGDRTPNDAFFLKAEIFRYDEDIDQRTISTMIETLSNKGKVHLVSGDIVLSDPPPVTNTGGKEMALFSIPAAPRPLKSDPLLDFEAFWANYPRRSGKGAARKAFLSQVSRGTSAAVIVQAAIEYADNCKRIGKEVQFIPHPATWLNQERYEDDVEQAPQVRSRVDDALRSGMDLVSFYQQQELNGGGQKEIGW